MFARFTRTGGARSVAPSSHRVKSRRTGAVAEPLECRQLLAHFAVIGDYTQGTPLRDVSNQIKSWNPDFIATVGDNWYSDPSIDDSVGQYFHSYISPYNGSYGSGSSSGNKFW